MQFDFHFHSLQFDKFHSLQFHKFHIHVNFNSIVLDNSHIYIFMNLQFDQFHI